MSLNKYHQTGSAAVEYLIGSLIMVLALLTPLANGQNCIELLVHALREFFAGWAYALSSVV